MKLFLCSHFSSVGSLIKEEIENKKIAFIPTASLREGYTGYVGSARKSFKKLGAIVTEIDISTEAYSTIQSVFEDADVIYFTGGNSFFLIDQLRKTGTDELLKKELAKGKLMIGESAGAIICAPSIQYIEQMDEKPEDYSQEAVSYTHLLFNLSLQGNGIAALESNVPEDELIEVILENDELKIDGNLAVCWSSNLEFTVERSTKTLVGSAVSGEGLVNVYRGTGRVLMCPVAPTTSLFESTNTMAAKSAAKSSNTFGK